MTLEPNWNERPNSMGFVPKGHEKQTLIVCAAIKHKDGTIFCASRHGSPAMIGQMQKAGASWHDCEEGFIDQFDRFWGRKEALAIVGITGQEVKYIEGGGGDLYSENLY